MKPQHQLMLRKVGKGKMFPKMKPEMRTHDKEDQSIKKITEDMEGMVFKKEMPKSVTPKRKPLKFKL